MTITSIPGYEHLSRPPLTFDQILELFRDDYIDRDTMATMVQTHTPERYPEIKSGGVWKTKGIA